MNTKKSLEALGSVLNQDSMKIDIKSTIVELPNGFTNLSRKIDVMKNVKISHSLKTLMKDRKITLKDLSKSTGIPISTLGSYTASEKSTYSADHISSLCTYFDVSADYLLFGKNTEVEALNAILTEELFSGWIKVRVERAIPIKNKK